MTWPRAVDRAPRGRLLVVSHPCVLPINQHVYVRLIDRGWDVTLVVPKRWRHEYTPETFESRPLPELAERLIPLRTVLAGRAQRHLYVERVGKLVREFAPDAAFFEEESFSLPALQWGLAARRESVPFGVQADENLDRPLPRVARTARAWTLRHAAFVAARSPTAGHLALRWGAKGAVVLVPHAVPGFERVPHPSRRVFTIGFAGRLVEEKGILDLLHAATVLEGQARLLFVGDGPLRPELERTTIPGVEVEVRTNVGHDGMPGAYAEMDVLALPSRTTPRWAEQFGRVLVEALWCGVPVVGSDSGEIPWVISETGGGRIVPEGDVPALAAALADLRDHPRKRGELARTGRAAVDRLFDLDAAATALDRALMSALEQRAGAALDAESAGRGSLRVEESAGQSA